MKKNVFAIVALLSTAAFAVNPKGSYLTWLGYEAGSGSYGSQSALVGAYSGAQSTNLVNDILLGTMCAHSSKALYNTFGAGFSALFSARECNNVIAIGKQAFYMTRQCESVIAIGEGAARKAAFCTNCVFIGNGVGAFSTNAVGMVDINGMINVNSEKATLDVKTANSNVLVSVNGIDKTFSVKASDGSTVMAAKDGVVACESVITSLFEESIDEEELKGQMIGADVYISASTGSSSRDQFVSADFSRQYPCREFSQVATCAPTTNRPVVVAVYEGVYEMSTIAAPANGMVFVAVGRRDYTVIEGAYNQSGGLLGISNSGSGSLTFKGFKVRVSGESTASNAQFANVEFEDCDICHGSVKLNSTSAQLFRFCDFKNCRLHDNRIEYFGGGTAYEFVFWACNFNECEISGNDFSCVSYLFRSCNLENSLIDNTSFIARYTHSKQCTFVATAYDNPYVSGYSSSGGIDLTTYNLMTNNFILVKDGEFKHNDTYYDFGTTTNTDGSVAYVASSNAVLTADYVAANVDCITVRDDGEPDYGYKTSAFGAFKYAKKMSDASSDNARNNIKLTDESTGETYIIKVKNGDIKLYKVEE